MKETKREIDPPRATSSTSQPSGMNLAVLLSLGFDLESQELKVFFDSEVEVKGSQISVFDYRVYLNPSLWARVSVLIRPRIGLKGSKANRKVLKTFQSGSRLQAAFPIIQNQHWLIDRRPEAVALVDVKHKETKMKLIIHRVNKVHHDAFS